MDSGPLTLFQSLRNIYLSTLRMREHAVKAKLKLICGETQNAGSAACRISTGGEHQPEFGLRSDPSVSSEYGKLCGVLPFRDDSSLTGFRPNGCLSL